MGSGILMKVKCNWVTCSFNAENVEYIKNNRKCAAYGLCECEDGIVLSSDVACENCKDDVDGLKCDCYTFISRYPLNIKEDNIMKFYEINRYQLEDKEYSKQLGSLNRELIKGNGTPEVIKSAYKTMCNKLREQLNLENTILLCTEENGEITIIEFDHKADGLTHEHYFEKGKGYYI